MAPSDPVPDGDRNFIRLLGSETMSIEDQIQYHQARAMRELDQGFTA